MMRRTGCSHRRRALRDCFLDNTSIEKLNHGHQLRTDALFGLCILRLLLDNDWNKPETMYLGGSVNLTESFHPMS